MSRSSLGSFWPGVQSRASPKSPLATRAGETRVANLKHGRCGANPADSTITPIRLISLVTSSRSLSWSRRPLRLGWSSRCLSTVRCLQLTGGPGQGGEPAVAVEAGVVQLITAMECAGRSHASRQREVPVATPRTKGRAAAVSVTQRAAAEPRDGFRLFHRTTTPVRDAHDVRRHRRSRKKARQDDQV